ncbi:MAG TPA: glycosyltransferase [Anaerolineales bacterium]|nr:glycosyltransferase [Anaerolineales bacterium]
MKKRIAVISEHASPLADLGGVDSGGQNVYVAHITQQLARLGYQVDVFTRKDDKALPEIYEWMDGVRVIHVPAGPPEFVRKEKLLGHMQAFTDYMIDFIKRHGRHYDLIHANFWMSGLVAANIKVALGIPFVITFHALGEVRRQFQGREDSFPEQRFEIERRIAHEADGMIAECPQDQDDLIQAYGAKPAKIRQIPCGFDPLELWPINKTLARLQIGVPEDEWLILQLGRMVPRKGVDTAIRGFAEMVRRRKIAARMVIVGGGSREPDPVITPEIDRLQKIAAEEGVADRVIFTGRRGRQELKYYFSAADVFISTPWYEPFGITPIEAMACGTPVIGADVGGIKHTVADGETGYLVPAKDPVAIADRLIELYENPDKRKCFSQNALERVNELFTWQKVGELLAEFYEDLLVDQKLEEGAHAKTKESRLLSESFDSAIETLQRSKESLSESIFEAAQLLTDCLDRGGKIMVCGNGGSAADAQHFVGELVGRFVTENRRGLPALALTADTVFLTAWANDIDYDQIFSRQVEALGQPGDVLVGISTSGRSANLVEAFRFAQGLHIQCLALLGRDGGHLLSLSDAAVVVPSWNTQRIQEVQILVLHVLCEMIERHISDEELETTLAIEQSRARTREKPLPLSSMFSINAHGRQK